jgi:hypothetical protein
LFSLHWQSGFTNREDWWFWKPHRKYWRQGVSGDGHVSIQQDSNKKSLGKAQKLPNSSRAAIKRKKWGATSLINSETCIWGNGRYESGDWLVDWCAEDLREEEIPQVVWSMVCNNQTVGSKLGTKEVFQVGEKRFPSGQEQVLLAEEPLDGRAVERWMIGDHLDERVDA